eukprot:UN33123
MSCEVAPTVKPTSPSSDHGSPAATTRRIDLKFYQSLHDKKAAVAKKVPMYMNVTMDEKSEIFKFEIKLTNSIGGLRKYIGKRYNCSPFQIELTANSRVLLNHQTIGQSGLSSNSIIECKILAEEDKEENENSDALDAMTCISHGLRPMQQTLLVSFDLKDQTKEGCVSFIKCHYQNSTSDRPNR